MSSPFASIAMRKFLFVTGKGGTGKSVLSVALAHRLAREGKRVWLVEMGRKRDHEFTRLPELLGVESLSHQPREVALAGGVKILASVLRPAESLAEYVDLKLPTAGFAGLLLNNKVTASFLEVVPGLPELVTFGKIWFALTQAKKDKEAVDCVVFDGPATGHALALLMAPKNFARITRVGPIHRDATQMRTFLADPEQTALVLALLPEEMAVQETLDIQKHLGKDFPKPHLFVNKCFPKLAPLAEEKDTLPYRTYEYARARAAREAEAIDELSRAVKLPFFFPEPGAAPLYARLAEAL